MELKEGYKQTEVGVIPRDWEEKSLDDISTIIMGQSPLGNSYNRRGNGVPLINGPTEFTQRFPIKIQWTSSPTNFCKGGDILICVRGSSTGRINISDGDYCIGRGVAAIRAREVFNQSYLEYQVFSSVKIILSLTAGSTFPNIDGKNLKQIHIPIPPTKAEQTAIATALSNVDALIQSLTTLIAKKRNIKQGTMQELLKPKEGWAVKKLGEVATLKARIGWQGLTTAEYKETGDYFLITGTDFINGFIDWGNCHFVEYERYKQDKNIQVKENDVLVTKDGTIGKVAFIKSLPKPATLNSGVFVIRSVEESFYSEFFYYILMSEHFSEFLSQLAAGSTISHLYQKDFVHFKFPLPATIENQISIATILSDMGEEITALETKLEKYKQLKQGMMQELLTGKTRLI